MPGNNVLYSLLGFQSASFTLSSLSDWTANPTKDNYFPFLISFFLTVPLPLLLFPLSIAFICFPLSLLLTLFFTCLSSFRPSFSHIILQFPVISPPPLYFIFFQFFSLVLYPFLHPIIPTFFSFICPSFLFARLLISVIPVQS